MTSTIGARYDQLIRRDKVHGSLYTDPAIFAEELRKIWYRTWVFVGHESEVAQPNDYVRKKLGLQDVIMTRDRDGEVHLLLNRCAHRGNQVCDDAKGNAAPSVAPTTAGRSATPVSWSDSRSSRGTAAQARPALGRVPRMDSYGGFVFGSFARTGRAWPSISVPPPARSTG